MSDRDLWCLFYTAALTREHLSAKGAANRADEALAELRARDAKKAFDKPEGSYRQG